MVMLTAAEPVRIYRVVDGLGRSIGEVVQPKSRPVLGAGAGTVLLMRTEGERVAAQEVDSAA